MDWNTFATIAELVGAIAVVVTLIFVVIQLRQNTQATHLMTLHDLIDDQASTMDVLNAEPDLTRIFYDGLRDFDGLSREDRRRFVTYMTSTTRRFESLLYQIRHLHVEPEIVSAIQGHWIWVCAQPGFEQYWNSQNRHGLFSKEVRSFFAQRLAEQRSESPD